MHTWVYPINTDAGLERVWETAVSGEPIKDPREAKLAKNERKNNVWNAVIMMTSYSGNNYHLFAQEVDFINAEQFQAEFQSRTEKNLIDML